MALVARMHATEVTGTGGGRLVACGPDEPGATPIEDAPGATSYYGPIPWLAGATHVRFDEAAQAQERFKLVAVSAKGEDDPNREWAAASPSGELTLLVQNPEAWGYVRPGATYRVTIERIRGPRNAEREQLAEQAEADARR